MSIDNDFIFDSEFESGNLDLVIKISPTEYDLFVKNDTNTKRHHSWFYFSVKCTNPKRIKFNIVNLTNSHLLYSQGMKICVLSTKKRELALDNKLLKKFLSWTKEGENISYGISKFSKELLRATNKVYSYLEKHIISYLLNTYLNTKMIKYTFLNLNLSLILIYVKW